MSANNTESMRNLLEPPTFFALFHEYPPMDFTVATGPDELPLFFTDFDLLTTLEPATRKRLEKIPLSTILTRRLTFSTCFTGTTVTEYTPLPRAATPAGLVENLLCSRGGNQSLTILKDIPVFSPLLSDDDNACADELSRAATARGFIQVEGQALAYLPLDFGNIDGYFAILSSGRRKDLRRKMKTRDTLEVEVLPIGDPCFKDAAFLAKLYAMYLDVYEQSQIHFDLLTPPFFAALLGSDDIKGVVVCYRHHGVLAGYNISLLHNGLFIDKYIGFSYPLARNLNLYFVSWVMNLEIALRHGCSAYVAGWTDPEVKMALGARFTFTRHLVWVKNPALRRVLHPLRRFFESDRHVLDGRQ